MNRPQLALYYLPLPEHDRWFPGDRFLRRIARRILRGKPRPGGIDIVFINLCKGLDLLDIPYEVNIPFNKLAIHQVVCIFGKGTACLNEYQQPNPIVAGIGLMTHPAQWPDLCKKYPVKRYLQHSTWCNDLYVPYYGNEICQDLWPVGIDTAYWSSSDTPKQFDFLIYNKIHWNKEKLNNEFVNPLKRQLEDGGFSYREIVYGKYKREEYKTLLNATRAMIFIAEHESQGLAYQEALSMDVPILAWNQGKIMDPQYKVWSDFGKPATSVPYWDSRCGETFVSILDFREQLNLFWNNLIAGLYKPKAYVDDFLTLKLCAQRFVEIVNRVNQEK